MQSSPPAAALAVVVVAVSLVNAVCGNSLLPTPPNVQKTTDSSFFILPPLFTEVREYASKAQHGLLPVLMVPHTQQTGLRNTGDVASTLLLMAKKTGNWADRKTLSTCTMHKYLLHHVVLLPVLYADQDDIWISQLNVEHVVPLSVLKKCHNPAAALDLGNLFLAERGINNARGDYRFAFHFNGHTVVDYMHDHVKGICDLGKRDSGAVVHVGHGNCINYTEKLFYPRVLDAQCVARTILYMHRKWALPLDEITIAGVEELNAIIAMRPPSTKERNRQILIEAVENGLVRITRDSYKSAW